MTRAIPLTILPDPPQPPEPLGLVAGGGQLPVLVARGMRERGHPVRVLGLTGQYDPALRHLADRLTEAGILRLGSWGRLLRRMDVRYAVMVGSVDKARLLHSWGTIIRNVPDLRVLRLFIKLRSDRRSHVILDHIARELEHDGVQLIDSTAHITEHLAHAGVMTDRRPGSASRADIDFGWPILREMLRLDIGQSIAVRERDVIAVEAVEGTDRMIARAGELCRSGGWTLIKAARAGHDRRSDVPTVGAETVRRVHAAGGRCIALAAGDVIMLDKAEMIRLADSLGVAIVGITPV
ncbi:MAG: UDP-2,3-diacylglucosamine diphosphatase LpxI [Planctomycetota bacterium]|nr:UDP-2,3-diacylglucosamine diphosphatase LpxI [Planctomycetota bacterium]